MDIDGEYFVHKTRDAEGEPRIQLIESQRIGDEFGSKETIDGVGLDAWGAPVFYRVLQDDGKGRDIPAPSILHIHEPEWAGGVRSHPPDKMTFRSLPSSRPDLPNPPSPPYCCP